MQKALLETTGPNVISTKRLGDLGEQWVTMLAAWKGAEVFPNGYTTGDCDLIMRYQGTVYQLDVKVSTWIPHLNYWHAKNVWLVKYPVYPVIVEPKGDFANWTVRWKRNAVPPGLENFWSKDYRIVSTTTNESTIAN